MADYTENQVLNVEFLGERARDLVEQEVERARTLDTKAAGLIAGSVALIGAAAVFANRVSDLQGGGGAKTLWAVELSLALLLLLVSGGLAVWALAPRVFRTIIAFHVLKGWVTPRVLSRAPTENRGTVLHADIISIGKARDSNKQKGQRLLAAFVAFAAALACMVALTMSVAIHATDQHPSVKKALHGRT